MGAQNIPSELFSRGKKDENVQLRLGEHELKQASQHRYLGVILIKD